MKYFKGIFLLLTMITLNCKAIKNDYNNIPILIGDVNKAQLQQDEYKNWYNKNYDAYILKTKYLSKLKDLKRDYKVDIYLGTWCPDSKRQVPRMVKILDSLNIQSENVTFYGLNEDKKSPLKKEKEEQITRVPTFIIKQNNIEINRIVEIPIESLEQDLLEILTKNNYKNAYAD